MNTSFILALLFAGVAMALHARRLPPQNLAAIALLIFIIAAMVEWSSLEFQVPFTSLALSKAAFWCLPLLWIGTLMLSRKLAQWLNATRKESATYGWWILAATALSSTVIWAVIEAVIARRFQLWNTAGRFVTGVAILLVIFPWLIAKRPVRNIHPPSSA